MPNVKLKDKDGNDVNFNGVSKIQLQSSSGGNVIFVFPNGTLNITENGIYDVSEKANVNINVSSAKPEQSKSVTPTKSQQEVTPDAGYALNKVVVNAIPDEYIIPNGTMEITENGSYDVTNKEGVDVNIPSGTTEEWDGSYTESDLGYTVTLQLGTYGSRNPFELDCTFTYSIDGGVTKIPLSGQTVPIVLNNVQTIGFYDTSAAALYLGTSISGSELGYVHGGNGVYEKIINIENDMTIYVSVSATNAGGGND